MEAGAMTPMQEPPGVPARSEPRPRATSEWLIDGFNVLQVGLLGGRDRSDWWSAPRRSQLLSHVAAFEPGEATIWVVFDGARPRPESGREAGAQVVFAPSADDWLVARVRGAEDPSRLAVVTADRRLAARVRHLGARVAAPAEFLARCHPPTERGDFTSV
jgi:hypothetical protein